MEMALVIKSLFFFVVYASSFANGSHLSLFCIVNPKIFWMDKYLSAHKETLQTDRKLLIYKGSNSPKRVDFF